MRLSKEQLDKIASLSDEELWEEVCSVAKRHGFTLPSKTPAKVEMQKLREAITGGAKLNLGEAVRILNEYKRGKV